MNDQHTQTISAFVDGESVDPDHLAAALDDPWARATLVDFVRMRDAVRADDPPLPASLGSFRAPAGERTFDSLRSLRAGPFDWLRAGWPAVAALLVLVFLAGLLAPRPWMRGGDDAGAAGPPAPSRVEKFTPGIDWHQSN